MQVGELWAKLGLDMKDFLKGLNDAQSQLNAAGDKMKNIGKSLSLSLTTPIVAAGTASAKFASDMNESINKVEVAFKNNAKQVETWSGTTLKSFGIAKGTALDMASTFGDMATSMDLNTALAAEMSTKLVGLAGDLASFKNISIDIANTALNGVFTGETESLKQLGIVMTQANLQEYAYSQGIKTKIEDMSQAEQVQLRYNYVLAKTTNAQGDFVRTGAGAANQMRVFNESLKELGSTVGQNILPIITPMITELNEWVQQLSKLDAGTQKNILTIAAITAAIGPAILVTGSLAGALENTLRVIGAAPQAINTAVKAYESLRSAGSAVALTLQTVATGQKGVYEAITAGRAVESYTSLMAAAKTANIAFAETSRAAAVAATEFKIALVKTGIGAAIVLLGALAAYLVTAKSETEKLIDAQKKSTTQTDANIKVIEAKIASNESEIETMQSLQKEYLEASLAIKGHEARSKELNQAQEEAVAIGGMVEQSIRATMKAQADESQNSGDATKTKGEMIVVSGKLADTIGVEAEAHIRNSQDVSQAYQVALEARRATATQLEASLKNAAEVGLKSTNEMIIQAANRIKALEKESEAIGLWSQAQVSVYQASINSNNKMIESIKDSLNTPWGKLFGNNRAMLDDLEKSNERAQQAIDKVKNVSTQEAIKELTSQVTDLLLKQSSLESMASGTADGMNNVATATGKASKEAKELAQAYQEAGSSIEQVLKAIPGYIGEGTETKLLELQHSIEALIESTTKTAGAVPGFWVIPQQLQAALTQVNGVVMDGSQAAWEDMIAILGTALSTVNTMAGQDAQMTARAIGAALEEATAEANAKMLEISQSGYDERLSAAKGAQEEEEETYQDAYDAAKEKYDGIVSAAKDAYEETVSAAAEARDEEVAIYQDQLDAIDEAESERDREESRQTILDKIKSATTAKEKAEAQKDLAEWEHDEEIRIQKEKLNAKIQAAKDSYDDAEKLAADQRDTVIDAADDELAAEKRRYDLGLAAAKEHYASAKTAADTYYASLGLAIDTVTGKLAKMEKAAKSATDMVAGVSTGTTGRANTDANTGSSSSGTGTAVTGGTSIKTPSVIIDLATSDVTLSNGTYYGSRAFWEALSHTVGWNADAQQMKIDGHSVATIISDGKGWGSIRGLYETALKKDVEWDAANNKVYVYAKGTNYVPDDMDAIVDEEGREIIKSSDGKITVGDNTGAKMVKLKKGDTVIPHKETEELLAHRSYAEGTGYSQYGETKRAGEYRYAVYIKSDGMAWSANSSGSLVAGSHLSDIASRAKYYEFYWADTKGLIAVGSAPSQEEIDAHYATTTAATTATTDDTDTTTDTGTTTTTSGTGTTTTDTTNTTTDGTELPINSGGTLIGDINTQLSDAKEKADTAADIANSVLDVAEAKWDDTTSDLTKEQGELDRLNVERTQKSAVVDAYKDALEKARYTYGENSDIAKGIENQLKISENDLAAVNNKITVQTAKVADLNTQTKNYTASITENNTALSDAETRLTAATAAYTEAKAKVASLTTELEKATEAHQKYADANVTGTAAYTEAQYQYSLQSDQIDLQIALEEQNKTTGYKSRIRKLEKQKEALEEESNIAALEYSTTIGAQQHTVDTARSETNEMSAAAIIAGYISTKGEVDSLTTQLATANATLETAQAYMEGLQDVTDTLTSYGEVLAKTYATDADKQKAVKEAQADVTTAWSSLPSVTMAAKGGVAVEPTLGIFAEEEPEALIPLTKLPDIIMETFNRLPALQVLPNVLLESLNKLPAIQIPVIPQATLAGASAGVGNQEVNFSFTFSGPISVRDDTDIKSISREIYSLAQNAWRSKGVKK